MESKTTFETEAERILGDCVWGLRDLSPSDANNMSETTDSYVVVSGKDCRLTIFRETLATGELLLIAQLSRPEFGGFVSFHQERGLVLTQSGETRDATTAELADSDG